MDAFQEQEERRRADEGPPVGGERRQVLPRRKTHRLREFRQVRQTVGRKHRKVCIRSFFYCFISKVLNHHVVEFIIF